jgi:hypothetical protein
MFVARGSLGGAYRYGEHFGRGGGVGLLQFVGGGEILAADVAGREAEFERGACEGVGVEHEVARAGGADFHAGVAAVAERQRVQQVGGAGEIDAGEQRQIVRGLQQAEMVVNGGVGFLRGRYGWIGCDSSLSVRWKSFCCARKPSSSGRSAGAMVERSACSLSRL